MEKPILPSPISLEEYRKKKQRKEQIENLNKMGLVDITRLVQEGKISESDIAQIESLTINEKYLLELMILETDEAQYQREKADNHQENTRRLEEYIEYLQEEIQGLNKDAVEDRKRIDELDIQLREADDHIKSLSK